MVYGPQLYNVLPRELREFEGQLEIFKNRVDSYLLTIPDRPALPHYAQAASGNSVKEQVAQLRSAQL